MLEITAEERMLVFTEGIHLRFLEAESDLPAKHQLSLLFEDGSCLYASVRMYGGLLCAAAGKIDNPYYLLAAAKPSPLSRSFTPAYFAGLLAPPEVQKLSVKAVLATEQRIPGLGNGVLQDILFIARIHPKLKLQNLSEPAKAGLYTALKTTLQKMATAGGRDTETDLFGNPGGYKCLLSKHTLGQPCPGCTSLIQKAAYMGGSIYFCANCQPLI